MTTARPILVGYRLSLFADNSELLWSAEIGFFGVQTADIQLPALPMSNAAAPLTLRCTPLWNRDEAVTRNAVYGKAGSQIHVGDLAISPYPRRESPETEQANDAFAATRVLHTQVAQMQARVYALPTPDHMQKLFDQVSNMVDQLTTHDEKLKLHRTWFSRITHMFGEIADMRE